MTRATPGTEAPARDPRYLELDEVMRRHHHRADGLIEVLHATQRLFGYLPREVLAYVARGLALPPSAVYGVATFYHFFSLAPAGAHTVTVCTGTACHVRRGTEILRAVERATGVPVGHTSGDGALSVAEARCLGPCSQAPIIVFDDEVTGELDVGAVLDRVARWRAT
jgi:bidirectional [NiFe] hydrogenase diaphorase subunit